MEDPPSKVAAKRTRLSRAASTPMQRARKMIATRPRVAQRVSLARPRAGPLGLWERGALVLIAAGAGAIVGAGLHPLPADRYQADAVVFVQPAEVVGGDDLAGASKVLAEAIQLPQVAQAAARSTRLGDLRASDIPSRVRTAGDLSGGLIRIRARAETQALATAVAGAVATEAVSFLRAAARTGLVDPRAPSKFSFDRGLEGWRPGSIFSLPARAVSNSPTQSLTFSCTGEKAGCGVGVQIKRTFTPDTTYRARAMARVATGGARLQIVLGSNSRDVATSESVKLHGRYRTLSATWTPRRPAGTATLALQTTDKHRAKIFLDTAAVVSERQGGLDPDTEAATERLAAPIRARRAVLGDRYTTVGGAAPVANATGHTARWALLGGLVGGLAAVGGLVLAALASRRAD